MNIGQHVCSSLMDPCKLHAALSVDVLYTKIRSDGFNGNEHPMQETIPKVAKTKMDVDHSSSSR